MALAAFALLVVALEISSTFERTSEMEKLEMLAETPLNAIRSVESAPCEIELKRELPSLAGRVTIVGKQIGGKQVLEIIVEAGEQVQRNLVLGTKVNEGFFTLSCENPSAIHLSKAGEIQLELI